MHEINELNFNDMKKIKLNLENYELLLKYDIKI
jgi:hypothetical protein